MASGQHRGQVSHHGPNLAALGIGLLACLCGGGCLCGGIFELLRYSPYEDPGALTPGYVLAGAGLLLILAPAAVLVFGAIHRDVHRYRTWKAGLTPAQRAWLTAAEIIGLYGIAIAWHEHNKHESARLTTSVMGPDRGEN